MNSKRLGERLNAFGLGVVMLIFSIPGLWVVLNAFRPNREILAKPAVWIPEELTLINFINMFGYGEMATIPVWSYFRNSLVISVTSTVIALLVGMMGGYAFARYRFRGKGFHLCWFNAVTGDSWNLSKPTNLYALVLDWTNRHSSGIDRNLRGDEYSFHCLADRWVFQTGSL